jgi:competence protein ComEA
LNEAMPPWRTFSSEAPAGPPTSGEPPTAPPRSSPPPVPWLAPLLAGLGGLAAGGAAVALLVVSFGASPPGEAYPFLGELLDADPALAAGETGDAGAADDAVKIIVDVAGAVARPGLHRLRAGDRVGDAIEAAGGFAPRVDLAAVSVALNLAQRLEDGSKVVVPGLGVDSPGDATPDEGRIDLNRAGQAELETLPGVGPVTARKIIAARSERRFLTVRDLHSRGLVSRSVFDELKDLVRAG